MSPEEESFRPVSEEDDYGFGRRSCGPRFSLSLDVEDNTPGGSTQYYFNSSSKGLIDRSNSMHAPSVINNQNAENELQRDDRATRWWWWRRRRNLNVKVWGTRGKLTRSSSTASWINTSDNNNHPNHVSTGFLRFS